MKLQKILIMTVFSVMLAASCCSGEDIPDSDLRVFEGRVTGVNISNSTLTVDGGIVITFPISPETKFVKDIYDIKLSDIAVNDYIIVEYLRRGSDSRIPQKVIKVSVQ